MSYKPSQEVIADFEAYGFYEDATLPRRQEWSAAFASDKMMLWDADGKVALQHYANNEAAEDCTPFEAQMVIYFAPKGDNYPTDSFEAVLLLDDGDDFRSFNGSWPDLYTDHREAALGAYQLLFKLVNDGLHW